jgi:hypothetical protein
MGKHLKFQPKINRTLRGKQVTISEALQFVIEEFLSTPLTERLENLSDKLKSSDTELAESIINIKAEFERSAWGTATYKDGEWQLVATIGGEKSSIDVLINEDGSLSMPTVMFLIDAHIERNLVNAIRALLDQQMVEALVGADQTPVRYQEHMRRAAGLKKELSVDTEAFLTRLHRRLYADARKKWLNIHPGGSRSLLTRYQGTLASHYERTHPIWKQAKKIYKKHGGGITGRQAVKREYRDWSPFIEGTLGAQNPNPKHIGLPDELIAKLADGKEYESSPEYLAHEHAAFLCNFKVGDISVRQIKAAIRAYKRMLGTEYYNHLYKGQPMSFPGRSK